MKALCLLKTNTRVVIVSALLICPFYAHSQSNEDESKNSQQSDEKETSYINVVGPLPYGQQLESAKKEPQVEPQRSLQEERLARIREFEAEFGPYDKSLINELLTLGLEYSEQGRHKLALNAFMRSLEIHTANFGLHNPDKFPIVEQLIIVNRALEEWTEVNKYYEYLYWLYRRTYGEYSVELIPMLSALIAWKSEAINQQLLGNGKTLFNEAQKASKRAKKIVKNNNSAQQQETHSALTAQ